MARSTNAYAVTMTDRVADFAESFGGTVITNLDHKTVRTGWALPVGAEFVLLAWLLAGQSTKPVISDVNYKPYHSKLLEQAESARGSKMEDSNLRLV
jgi:hypothetical protein